MRGFAALAVYLSVSMATAAQAQDRLTIPASVFVVSQAADWHSTQQAIRSGHGREGNPLMPIGSAEQAAIKIGASVAIVYVAHRLNKNHPKLAKGLLWVGSAVTCTVAARNYRIAR